jgi:protein translocase SecG subunit
MSILTVLCYILFVLAAIVLIVVVLLPEGRGGGFGEALGVHGRETFGPGSKGINTFTGWTAGVFLASALVIHYMNKTPQTAIDSIPTAPSVLPTDSGAGAPADGAGAPAPADSTTPPSNQ